MPGGEDPFLTGERLLVPLVRWTPLESVTLTWFREDGSSVFLAVHGKGLPSAIAAGATVPESRNAYFRSQAENGPWISGWTVRQDDGGYSKGVAAAGIKAAVSVPLNFEVASSGSSVPGSLTGATIDRRWRSTSRPWSSSPTLRPSRSVLPWASETETRGRTA